MPIAENIARAQERIARAARRAGREPDAVALMAVTKTVAPERILEAYDAGVRLFGENRVQEFAEKAADLRQLGLLANDRFHMIGHLQTNKARKAVELFSGVDSVDSLRLAEALNAAAQKHFSTVRLQPQGAGRLAALIEINLAGEAQKSGLAPASPELEALLQAAPRLEFLDFRGLMCVPPLTDDPEAARPWFRALRELRDQLAARQLPGVSLDVLSMGMTHDFEVAIEEGSTCVRLGTAIFGPRPK